METYFAPAERATPEELDGHRPGQQQPGDRRMMHSVGGVLAVLNSSR